ncbi:MAG: class I SAM-dependent methyltransferase [Dehalococcoidia bacterium]|nr:class I SAM-dependent methyltransferase [Dehalococcoidia bacterium]
MTSTLSRPVVSRNWRKHTNPNPAQRWLLDRFHRVVAGLVRDCLPHGGTVLDLGCGEGFAARAIATAVPGLTFIGLDRSRAALLDAMARLPAARGVAQADAALIPVARGGVEVALALEVLEHLVDPDATMRELGRVARDWVIVSTPNQPFFAAMNLARLKNLSTWGDDPEHVHWWTARAFVHRVALTLPVEHVAISLPWTIVVARGRGG